MFFSVFSKIGALFAQAFKLNNARNGIHHTDFPQHESFTFLACLKKYLEWLNSLIINSHHFFSWKFTLTLLSNYIAWLSENRMNQYICRVHTHICNVYMVYHRVTTTDQDVNPIMQQLPNEGDNELHEILTWPNLELLHAFDRHI